MAAYSSRRMRSPRRWKVEIQGLARGRWGGTWGEIQGLTGGGFGVGEGAHVAADLLGEGLVHIHER